jgi:hypothetical protein
MMYDLYDGCILAAMQGAGLTDPWMGQLLKCQADNESGITPSIELSTDPDSCGGQNCGPWAISAGTVSGDQPPGPWGSMAVDPAASPPGTVDYSHSYGLFQSTPACEGTFLTPTLPMGVTCTQRDVPWSERPGRQHGQGLSTQTTSSPLYATSIFNPAYQIYTYINFSWKYEFMAANAKATGCTTYQQWYLTLAYWLTGNATTTCTLSGSSSTRSGTTRRCTARPGRIPVRESAIGMAVNSNCEPTRSLRKIDGT